MDDWLEKTATGIQKGCDKITFKLYREFLLQARSYFVDMTSMYSSLQSWDRVFNASYDIRQNQCNLVISALASFNEPVQRFSNLLKDVNISPMSFSPKYYILIVSLDCIDEQANQLQSLITCYRPNCCSYTKSNMLKKYEIQIKLKKFIAYSEEALQQISHFIDGAYFGEKQLQNAQQEKLPVITYYFYEIDNDIAHREKDNLTFIDDYRVQSTL